MQSDVASTNLMQGEATMPPPTTTSTGSAKRRRLHASSLDASSLDAASEKRPRDHGLRLLFKFVSGRKVEAPIFRPRNANTLVDRGGYFAIGTGDKNARRTWAIEAKGATSMEVCVLCQAETIIDRGICQYVGEHKVHTHIKEEAVDGFVSIKNLVLTHHTLGSSTNAQERMDSVKFGHVKIRVTLWGETGEAVSVFDSPWVASMARPEKHLDAAPRAVSAAPRAVSAAPRAVSAALPPVPPLVQLEPAAPAGGGHSVEAMRDMILCLTAANSALCAKNADLEAKNADLAAKNADLEALCALPLAQATVQG